MEVPVFTVNVFLVVGLVAVVAVVAVAVFAVVVFAVVVVDALVPLELDVVYLVKTSDLAVLLIVLVGALTEFLVVLKVG